jgi:hypothetical protein
MNTDTFQTLEVPLNKLLAWNQNVRTTGADEGIDELAASIASVGLLQGLVVKKEPRGKYSVIAGPRDCWHCPGLPVKELSKQHDPFPAALRRMMRIRQQIRWDERASAARAVVASKRR